MTEENKVLYATGWRRFILLQPSVFLLILSAGMTGIVTTDMILHQTCRLLLAANKSACDLLRTNSSSDEALEIDKMVHPYASYIILCDSIIHNVISALLILFLGPWSDKYGRKPLLIIGYFATILRYVLLSIINFWDVNPWMYMIASVSSALIGGGGGLMLATMCYITDITTIENRAWHLACFEGAIMAGIIIGTLSGPFIFHQFGYIVLFAIAAVFSFIALLHIIIYVPETVKKEKNVKLGNPFNLSLIKEMFEASVKKRSGLNRWTLWNCIFVLSLFTIFVSGEGKIGYLFMNTRIGWNAKDYGIYQTVSIVVAITGTIAGLKLTKDCLGFSDLTQALVGCLSGFFTMIIISFSLKPWHLYVATCTGLFVGMIAPTVRSILSASAPSEDIGKIFTVISFIETLVPLGGVALYTLVYSNYMPPFYPSPVFLLSAGIFLFMMLLLLNMNWRMVKHPPPSQEKIQKHELSEMDK